MAGMVPEVPQQRVQLHLRPRERLIIRTAADAPDAARLRHAVPPAHLDDLELPPFRTVGARVSVLEDAALVARADRAVDARL